LTHNDKIFDEKLKNSDFNFNFGNRFQFASENEEQYFNYLPLRVLFNEVKKTKQLNEYREGLEKNCQKENDIKVAM
jgi:hypothetical protein